MKCWLIFSGILLLAHRIPAQSVGPHTDKSGGFNPQLQELVPLDSEGFAALLLEDPLAPDSMTISIFDKKENLRSQQKI